MDASPHKAQHGYGRLAALCLVLALVSPPARAIITGPIPPEASCPAPCHNYAFAYDFINLTGQNVNGIGLNLRGPNTVSAFAQGPQNPFGLPTHKGYDTGGGYLVRFGASTLPPGQWAHVGICSDHAFLDAVPRGNDSAFHWLLDDEPVRSLDPPAIGHGLRPISLGNGLFQLALELTQSEFRPLVVLRVDWTVIDGFLPVEQLSWPALAGLPWQSLQLASNGLPAPEPEQGPSRMVLELPGQFHFADPHSVLVRFEVGDPAIPAGEPAQVRGLAQTSLQALLRPAFFAERARETAAGMLGGLAEDFSVISATETRFELLGTTAQVFKVEAPGGTLHRVALDAAGLAVDVDGLAAQEEILADAIYGKLDPALAEQLVVAPPQEPVGVMIWLHLPAELPGAEPQPPPADSDATPEEIDAYLAAVDHYHAQRTQAVTEPFAVQLNSLGSDVVAHEMAPVVFARLLPPQIVQVAGWPQVSRIRAALSFEQTLEIAGPVVRSNLVHSQGVTGNGIRLGVIEVGGIVVGGNPFLAGVTQNATNACLDPHSTAVAGVIASTHATRTGAARGAALFAAGSCFRRPNIDNELMQAATWAANQGCLALNLSFGAIGRVPTLNNIDGFYDDMVINNRRTVVVAAGNSCPCGIGGGIITSPGRAYNVITVGNFDDRDTVEWSDDGMGPCSSFVDPPSTRGDREKPEVSAPGTNINSTTHGAPWTGGVGSGTSFAAPQVTGGAGLLFERDPTLRVWPEATKAILMATAVHNIEGNSRLSDQDGAGGVALDEALLTAFDGERRRWGARAYGCTQPFNLDVQTMQLLRGRPTRIAIAWDQEPTYARYANEPSADLDLSILDPTGAEIARSVSWDNTYEIVEFTAPLTGQYRIRVQRFRCTQSPRWLGWAWWQGAQITVDGVGWDAQGAGMEIADLNGNGTPDMVLMAYDAPPGANAFRYKIGWDLDASGEANAWSGYHEVAGVGDEGQGASVKVADLDNNGQLDMVLMADDNPPGANTFRYKIGWNLNTGATANWSNTITVAGVGHETQGAGLELADLDGNGRLDMILMAYDNPPGQNTFRYKIGWNLSNSGQASSWSGTQVIDGVGHQAQGAGVTVADLDRNGRPEMLLMAYDNPPGPNTFRYRIGWNLNLSGTTSTWSQPVHVWGVGNEADGADPLLFDVDNDGNLDLFLMAYDDPPQANTFRYKVVNP